MQQAVESQARAKAGLQSEGAKNLIQLLCSHLQSGPYLTRPRFPKLQGNIQSSIQNTQSNIQSPMYMVGSTAHCVEVQSCHDCRLSPQMALPANAAQHDTQFLLTSTMWTVGTAGTASLS